MSRFLPSAVVGVLSTALIFVNTFFWAVPIYILSLVKLCLPRGRLKRGLRDLGVGAAECWVACNNFNFAIMGTTVWDIRGIDELKRDGSYFVNANHQSWADVVVLQKALGRRVPFLMFFIKKELVWLPILGLAWKGLDFPFMQRFSREYLQQHPEMRGKDLEATRALCSTLRGQPVAIMSFLEGTRFSPSKHARQESPYRRLLKPKAGGAAFVMNAIGDQLEALLDVTIAYPSGRPTIWQFVSGRCERVIVDIRRKPLPKELVTGDYASDEIVRETAQQWVHGLWEEKDERLEALLADEAMVSDSAHR